MKWSQPASERLRREDAFFQTLLASRKRTGQKPLKVSEVLSPVVRHTQRSHSRSPSELFQLLPKTVSIYQSVCLSVCLSIDPFTGLEGDGQNIYALLNIGRGSALRSIDDHQFRRIWTVSVHIDHSSVASEVVDLCPS